MNNINVVIQALLWKSEEPMSGYDIAKIIKEKTGNSHQQIYRELAKIGLRKDVKVDLIEQNDKPNKKIYSFKDKSDFVNITGQESDFSKTTLAYEILIGDILNETNYYDKYIQIMKDAEAYFLEVKNEELHNDNHNPK